MRTIWAALLGGGLLLATLSGTGVSTAPVASAALGESESVSAEADSPDGDDTDGGGRTSLDKQVVGEEFIFEHYAATTHDAGSLRRLLFRYLHELRACREQDLLGLHPEVCHRRWHIGS